LNTAYFYPNNGSYGSWRVAGTRNAWQGLEFDTSNGQFSLMMTASGNNYTGVHHNGWGWKWYFVNQDLYCNAYRGFNNVAGTGNASYHPNGIYSTGTNWLYGQIITNNNQINAGSGSIFSGRMQPSLSNAGSAYTSVQCELRSTFGNGGVAGITGHIVNHLAPVLRVWTGTGEGFDCNNSAGTVYAYVGGSQFITRSSGRFKKHIKERDNSEVIPRALDLLACRTVIWDDTYLDGEWCEESGCIVNKEVCDDENCECECCSTARVDPINRRHFNRRGYLAEELAEVLPEAVHFESDGTPSGIDYSMVTVELMDMVKLLVLQCEDQERRIKELEYANA
jgi:hypothetical protein